jgi:hypothetical protein
MNCRARTTELATSRLRADSTRKDRHRRSRLHTTWLNPVRLRRSLNASLVSAAMG